MLGQLKYANFGCPCTIYRSAPKKRRVTKTPAIKRKCENANWKVDHGVRSDDRWRQASIARIATDAADSSIKPRVAAEPTTRAGKWPVGAWISAG